MNVLTTILYILLFIVCLSLLIMIHELGHFTAAKIFKVYVLEYSIGLVPRLSTKRGKMERHISPLELFLSVDMFPCMAKASNLKKDKSLKSHVH